ncbi:lipid droplet assembly factor 1 isoform X1 [Dipodomys merriami]|uniref:lipid droplet assembly factor 1 isoform X1 n=1 Tax=Dipodomys merriami TaxID=94247 RepID=UPI003855F502
MAKEEPPSTSRDLQELQRKLSLLIKSFQNNSKVVAFMKSPVGQYLDRHPFLALAVLVFVAMSAIPVGFFLLFVVLTSLLALVGVVLLEGLVISVGGLTLLCVLCGVGFVSLTLSGMILVTYMVTSSFISYWFSPRNSRTILKRSGESGHPCLVPDFRGNGFSFSPFSMMVAVGLSYIAFIILRPLTQQNPSVICQLSTDLEGLHQE